MRLDSAAGTAIRKLRMRIWLNNIVESLVLSILFSSSLILLLSVGGHVAVITDSFYKAGRLGAILCTAGVIAGAARRPGLQQAARQGDVLGMKERLTTYLEYENREGAVLNAFRMETEQALARFDPVKAYRINFRPKAVLTTVLILAVSACLFMAPSPRVQEARQQEGVNRELRREAQKVAALKNALAEENGRDFNSQTQAAQMLAELEKSLQKSRDYQESALQVAETVNALEALQTGIAPKEAAAAAGVFLDAGESLAAVAEHLRQGDAEKAAELLAGSEITAKQRSALLKNTRRLLAQGGMGEQQKQLLKRLQSGLKQQDFTPQTLSRALQAASDDKEGALKLGNTAAKLESMKERLLAASGEGLRSPGGSHKGSDFAEGDNRGRENGEITDRQATLLAQGAEGYRAARNPDALGGGIPGGGGGEEAGREGRIGESEAEVWAGSASNGPLWQLQGGMREEGGHMEERISDQVVGLPGESGEYEEWRQAFAGAEMHYMEKHDIPAEQRALVMEYFRMLRGGE